MTDRALTDEQVRALVGKDPKKLILVVIEEKVWHREGDGIWRPYPG